MENIKPLQNVTVLEIGTSLAEQLVGRHLQLLGARVITLSKSNYILTDGKELANLDDIECDVIITRTPVDIDPNIIYLSMPNFSSTDEEYKDVADYEVNIMALSGVYMDMGVDRKLMGIPASYTQLPLASTYGSVYGALAVVVALNRGGGDVIEVPLASALMDTLVYNSIEYDCPELYKSKRCRYSGDTLDYYEVQELKDPFFCHYVCSDGRPFYLVAPGHINHQLRTFKVLDIEEEVEELGIPIVDSYNRPGRGLGAGQIGDEWIKPLKSIMKRAFLTKIAFEWEFLFGNEGIPSTSHRTTEEWIYSEHACESGLIENRNGKIYPGPISWVQCEKSDNKPVSKPDINVLDLSNVIAGPTIGSMLARFGANVTKVDMPNPTYSPDITIIFGMVANANKKSILLDVKKGKEVIQKLIKETDMVIVNSTDSSLDRLELSPDILKKINPNIILVQFDAWGGPNLGRRSNYLGYDDNVQAGVGIMERFGGGLGRVEEHAHVGTIDVVAGVAGALSAMSALYYKKNNSGMLIARTSLAALGQLIQFPFICSNPSDNIRTGCKGENELLCLYETLDNRWVVLVGKYKEELIILDERFENQLFIDVFKQETANTWKEKLNIQILVSIEELRDRYINRGDTYQFVTYPNHPIGSSVTMFAPCSIRSRNFFVDKQPPAPKYGQDTKILERLDVDLESLLDNNIISTQWSDDYLPV